MSFQLLLVTPEDVLPPGTDHYRAVVGVAARTLGAISRRVSLAHVVDPFLKWVLRVCTGASGGLWWCSWWTRS